MFGVKRTRENSIILREMYMNETDVVKKQALKDAVVFHLIQLCSEWGGTATTKSFQEYAKIPDEERDIWLCKDGTPRFNVKN